MFKHQKCILRLEALQCRMTSSYSAQAEIEEYIAKKMPAVVRLIIVVMISDHECAYAACAAGLAI